MIVKQKILFNRDECNKIIDLSKINLQHWNSKDRKYVSSAIDYKNETKWIFDKLKSFFESETNVEIYNLKKQIHFHKFKENDWFDKHNDMMDKRLYAVGVLLNDEFEGGDFILYNPTEFVLDKLAGNSYIFDVRVEHEIKPILKGERYSLLWFLHNNNIKIVVNSLI